MGQHRPLGHACRAAGILQHGQIIVGNRLGVGRNLHMIRADVVAPGLQRLRQPDMSHFDRFDRPVPVFLHQPDNAARQHRQKLGYTGDDHVWDRMAPCRAGHLVGKHVGNDQCMRFGIFELLGHLVFGIERVDVHQHAPGLEDPESRHRKAERIRHLHRHPVAGVQPGHLAQIHRERIRHRVDLGKAERAVHAVGQHAGKGLGGRVGLGNGADQFRQVPVR